MPVPYTPTAVANSFISQFGASHGIEHMKLQKLVYCSYGWWLAAKGMAETRLTTEGPEIWRHGPVFSSMYSTFRIFGRQPITAAQSANPFFAPQLIDADDEEVRSLVQWIWQRYGHLSSFELSDMTHKPGTPWHRVATDRNFVVPMHTEIPDQYIFEEFSQLLNIDRARMEAAADGVDGNAAAATA